MNAAQPMARGPISLGLGWLLERQRRHRGEDACDDWGHAATVETRATAAGARTVRAGQNLTAEGALVDSFTFEAPGFACR
ncbi:MAG: hypothetical protein QOJ29_315 [Thermoleophilaceae bacterium]|nr:hypothetical protein [Thermoleophilaceae bacterium]